MNTNTKQAIINNFINKNVLMNNINNLPEEIVRKIMLYRPRNETAELIIQANTQDKFRLNYVNKSKSVNEVWNTLRPIKTGSNTYGDEDAPMKLIRANISLGEKKRIRHVANTKV